jgi:cellulose biosynthesis protein BcsQ
LAQKGYKVCLIDLDPQCNLTRLSVGDENFQASLFSQQDITIYNIVEGIVTAKSDIDITVKPERLLNGNGNLFLVRGDQRLSNYDDLLAGYYAQAAGGSEAGYRQTSAISRYIKNLGMEDHFDLFVLDTSPTLGSLNKIVLLDTDYFVVPVNPDAFSLQGIENLGLKLEEWKRNWKNTGQALAAKIPTELVLRGEGLFIGYVLNSYNVYAKKLIKDHDKWAGLIPTRVKEFLSERHSKNGLVAMSHEHPLGIIQDYGLIPAKCQELSSAIFDISPEVAASLQFGTKENVEKAKQEFEYLAGNIIQVLEKY